ncbi:uroporphyrinogen-III synthase [Halococcus agarilyticus]|uniref:uroporphyrinogen-III synthase n=1 Tax=Halococcus agarilyticus TaxID=1232219 RepID=UPI000677F4EB|nr:uroporphyrinogen-III synthase [Halococcus agarilyticus]
MKVAVFRPADERIEQATELLESLGVEPVADPMLAIESTGAVPRADAEYTILTSKTGVEIVADAGWEPDGSVCAIGTATADALRAAGYQVDRVPDEFSSAGLVAHLAEDVPGARVEVARSDHGSAVLTDGLAEHGAYVHETILYELARPPDAGRSTELAASGDLGAALFTSSLTVEHFLDTAADRGIREAAITGLEGAVVGAIGEPTRLTAAAAGIGVDVVPSEASFEALARETAERLPG